MVTGRIDDAEAMDREGRRLIKLHLPETQGEGALGPHGMSGRACW
ncbi:MAG TPA: hypothetical protein VGK51_13390 [Actinomycetota bacterium]